MNAIKIPAIRSKIGIWIYYVTSLSFKEVYEFVRPIDDELHKSKLLRDMIQRSITDNYKSIANYIETQEERFFNALILAVYDGDPVWNEIRIKDINGEDNYDMGILTLSGNEKIFPVDGQHRVAGIKKSIDDNPLLESDRIPVVFIGHSKTEEGMKKTRRMFSTLNRYAKPVSLRDIIALDEDDIVAIASRNLIDESDMFDNSRIFDAKTKAIPESNEDALTSIITYYECNRELLWLQIKDTVVHGIDEKTIKGKQKLNEYIRHRPSDESIESFTQLCKLYWCSILGVCVDLKKGEKVGKYRNKEGGHIFFRPVSLIPFTKAIVRIKEKENTSFENIMKKLPDSIMWIQNPLWKRIIWDNDKHSMIMGHQKLIELIILYSYNKQYLSQSETSKICKELVSIWDYHDSDILRKLDSLIGTREKQK